jgi:thioredoxin-like negative regulator of GroEL
MAPTWEEFATATKGSVNVAKVDVTQNRDLAAKFGIKGFPTLKFFSGGKVYDYSGARTLSAFKEFAESGYTKTEGRRI